MYDVRNIFKKSITIYFYVATISILISVFFGNGFIGSIEVLGNLSIIEAAFFFIIGGLKAVFRSPSLSGLGNSLKIGIKKWTIEDLKNAEESGLVFIMVALSFFFETIILAFLH